MVKLAKQHFEWSPESRAHIEQLRDLPIRHEIDRLFRESRTDEIAYLEGISLVEAVNRTKPPEFCEQYIFIRVMGEPWKTQFYKPLSENSTRFLGSKGYNIVKDAPKDGDIVSYRDTIRGYPNHYTHHWGLWENGFVRSKFGNHGVYRHRIDHVPTEYGDIALFFRKAPKNAKNLY